MRSVVHTVDDGTDDLVNLSSATSLGAGEAGRQSRQGIDSERLEGASADRGRSSERSPPEGPGETARSENGLVSTREGEGEGRGEGNWQGDAPLEHGECVKERGEMGGSTRDGGWRRRERKKGKRLT